MKHAEVKAVIDEYLELVAGGGPDAVPKLGLLLDRLALAVAELRFDLDERDRADPATSGYSEWRVRATRTFPELGHYNAARPVPDNAGQAELVIGDAIDDVADIAGELEGVSLRWAESPDDALWHLEFTFRYHWGEHLRNLQLFLHTARIGW